VRLRATPLSIDRIIAASPVWIRLVDTFRDGPPVGATTVTVERRDGARWLTVDVPYELKPRGDLAFLNLGRVRRGDAGTQIDFRVTVAVAGGITETANGSASEVLTVTTWSADAPPATPPPQEIRCYPAPDYPFSPGIPLVNGTVQDANGDAVGRARVRVTETILGKTLIEEVRTNDSGWFRLPLRWSSGATQIDADRAGATGSQTINVPADLGSVVSITIS
jgi:hypothetical protein